jgi:hypothetical protein
MQDSPLRQLDNRTIAIEFAAGDRKSIFKGVGHFENHSTHGPVLRTEVSHPQGKFAIQLRANEWRGHVDSGEPFGCDFLLHLSATSVHQEQQ